MAFLDGEMDGEARARFEEHLAACPRCRSEFEPLSRVKEVTTRMKLADREDRDWELYWGRVYNRMERDAGWILLSVGATVLFSFGAYRVFLGVWNDASLPVVVRIGIGCALLGIVVLFVSVARQRFHAWLRDPYRRVQR
ncbi:MAG: zf-HC2 domain-containing protein [Candidatus Eisenbacteria bacterium]